MASIEGEKQQINNIHHLCVILFNLASVCVPDNGEGEGEWRGRVREEKGEREGE